jgi:hypothetical protein
LGYRYNFIRNNMKPVKAKSTYQSPLLNSQSRRLSERQTRKTKTSANEKPNTL